MAKSTKKKVPKSTSQPAIGEAVAVSDHEVVIIGAGPAGLSLAHCLVQQGIEPVLLESGDAAGHSWANMPQNITLLSPWKVNHLPGTRATATDQHKMHTCHEFSAYLRDYAGERRFDVRHNTPVLDVTHDGGNFVVHTGSGDLRTGLLVNATGYFAKPRMPTYPNMDGSRIHQRHVHDFHSAERLHRDIGVHSPRVLVVGRRISAGQTLAELHDAGLGFDVVLSTRGPVSFAPRPWALKLSFWVYFLWEDRQVLSDPFGLDDTFPPMEGGREKDLLLSGAVRQVPDIARFHDTDIEFKGGMREPFDAVIYTTGFLPALDHLNRLISVDEETGLPRMSNQQSMQTPGLYFLGLDKQRSFRSRYLRGIREDAKALADELVSKVNSVRRAG